MTEEMSLFNFMGQLSVLRAKKFYLVKTYFVYDKNGTILLT